MAKVAYSKLNKKARADVSCIVFNDQTIEVRHYLSINEKLDLISKVVERSLVDEARYFNDLKVDMFLWLEVLYTYTNISFTDKQKEDETKIFDNCWSNGLCALIFNEIPNEINDLRSYLVSILRNIYAFQNSAVGVLNTISQDYSNLDYDLSNMVQNIKDPASLELLKQIGPILGLN